ncbi:MAG TPA: ABC transporter permease subunit [Acidimicrobiia bacterium]
MLADIWTKTLWDQRRSLLGWAIGFVAVAVVYGGFYPFASTPEYAELIDNLPAGLAEAFGWDEISTAHGYLGSTVYGILGPVLVIIMAIAFGAKAIAGNEEAGHLELLIAQPVTRSRVVLQRAVALVIATLVGGLAVFISIVAIRGPVDIELPIGNIAVASLNLALLGAVFGTLALLVGGFVGKRGLVVGVSAVVAVATYLANGLAPQIEELAWLQDFSPFYWFAGTATLRDGIDLPKTLLLAAVSLAFVAIATVAFNRRDVGV